MMYIVIGPYCWGRANTTGAAIRGAKRACPTFIKKETMPYHVYEVTDEGFVNEQGDIQDAVKPKKLREVSFVGTQRIVKDKFSD
jgi:hypothetical protein